MSIRKVCLFAAGVVAIFALAIAANSLVPSFNQSRPALSDSSPRAKQPSFTAIESPAIEINLGGDDLSAAKVTVCDAEWMDVARFALNSWYTGGEYYAVYQDPVETGCPSGITYPFEVQNVIWHVNNPNPTELVVDLQPLIYTADLTDPLCPKPGQVCCYGPLFTVTLPAGPGGVLITLPLDSGCCVQGPYFAGILAPDFIGTDLLGVVTDSAGAGVTFGSRICASYNNYRGFWEDLIVDYSFPGNLRLWSDGTASDMNNCDPCAQIIEPGPDLWETPPGSSFDNHFSALPLPADFFGPGSDPFDGQINLQGSPLQTLPPGALGTTDAIVERLDAAPLPAPGASVTIPIEIVALKLVSSSPITVTSNGGLDPELWDVELCLSAQVPQQQGTMTITKECCNGGTFSSTLPVTPKFTFVRQSDQFTLVLDPLTGLPPVIFETQNGYWSYEIPPPFQLVTCPGLVFVDHDCDENTPEVFIPPSSKFTPGFRTVPCDPQNPFDPFCGGKVLTLEQELLAQHGVLPPQATDIQEGACCLPDGTCIITTPECCEFINSGIYQGDLTLCTPDLCPLPVDTLFDTLCTIAEIIVTLDPSDATCQFPLAPIQLADAPLTPTIVRRTPGPPYTQGQTIETEIVQMELTGISPDIGNVILRLAPSPPSPGQVLVTGVDGNGELTSGDSFFDVFVEIELPDAGMIVVPAVPILMESQIPALPPPPGTVFQPHPASPPIMLLDGGTGQPVGWLCFVTHTIVDCTCCIGIRGDINGDGDDVNILDLTFIVDFIFRGGPRWLCDPEADVDGDGDPGNIVDLTFVVDRIFRGGVLPPPCP